MLYSTEQMSTMFRLPARPADTAFGDNRGGRGACAVPWDAASRGTECRVGIGVARDAHEGGGWVESVSGLLSRSGNFP